MRHARPPAECRQPDDAYRHDGFYLRFSNETQYLAFLGRGPDGSASVKGLGSGAMLALGGTPLPGLVIAGVVGSEMVRGKFKGRPAGDEEDASMARAMLGVLVDWYPRPDDGWHVGAALGFAGITLTDAALADAIGAAFSAKLFGGYDWWIGPQWALGSVFKSGRAVCASDSGHEFEPEPEPEPEPGSSNHANARPMRLTWPTSNTSVWTSTAPRSSGSSSPTS